MRYDANFKSKDAEFRCRRVHLYFPVCCMSRIVWETISSRGFVSSHSNVKRYRKSSRKESRGNTSQNWTRNLNTKLNTLFCVVTPPPSPSSLLSSNSLPCWWDDPPKRWGGGGGFSAAKIKCFALLAKDIFVRKDFPGWSAVKSGREGKAITWRVGVERGVRCHANYIPFSISERGEGGKGRPLQGLFPHKSPARKIVRIPQILSPLHMGGGCLPPCPENPISRLGENDIALEGGGKEG